MSSLTVTVLETSVVEVSAAGPAGAAGSTGGFRFAFSTTITDSDPGAGNLRFDNATFASITNLFIDEADAVGADVTDWLTSLDDSTTSANKGNLRVVKASDPNVYREFRVTGSVVDGTGYRKVPVTPIVEAGTLVNADAVTLMFTRTGDAGAGGAGSGDMVAATYDPTAVAGDAFDMANMAEAADAKVLTAAERTKLTGVEASATADQTGAEIKVLYEAEANAFTDALFTKLSGIEASADVTDAGNVAAASAVMDGDFSTNGFMKRTGAGTYGISATVSLASEVSGNLPVANLAGGSGASSATFWRGDGVWAAPAGGGGGDLLAANNLSDVASAATSRTNLGLAIGTDVQAFDADLNAIAGLTSAADRLPYYTGAGTAALATFTSFSRTLLDDANAAAARTTLGLGIGTDVQAFDADTLKADTADVLTAGFGTTVHDDGTKTTGTFTPGEADGNHQRVVNGGAFTLAPPTNNCSIVLHITNNGSAGAITTTGFTAVDGDSFSTTDTDEFIAYITKVHDVSHMTVKALQ